MVNVLCIIFLLFCSLGESGKKSPERFNDPELLRTTNGLFRFRLLFFIRLTMSRKKLYPQFQNPFLIIKSGTLHSIQDDTIWVELNPQASNSCHQDYYIFSSKSQPNTSHTSPLDPRYFLRFLEDSLMKQWPFPSITDLSWQMMSALPTTLAPSGSSYMGSKVRYWTWMIFSREGFPVFFIWRGGGGIVFSPKN